MPPSARLPAGAPAYLKACNPMWNAVGRVTFHLAENKRNPAYPFAFLATYTHRMSEQGKMQHLALGRALEEYAGAKNRTALSALLLPIQRAAEQSKLARELLESRAVFHSAGLAARPGICVLAEHSPVRAERPGGSHSGLVEGGAPPRGRGVTVRIGEAKGKVLGAESLLDFNVEMSLEGEPLSVAELQALLQSASGLALAQGQMGRGGPRQAQGGTRTLAESPIRFERRRRAVAGGAAALVRVRPQPGR